jgi:nicotinamidase-related amidase
MHPAATLLLDVCVQPDFWPGGSWPLLGRDQARNVERIFALAARLGARQGGIVCDHATADANDAPELPAHCRREDAATTRPPGCAPVLPMRVCSADAARDGDAADRTFATYLDSGCRRAPDERPSHRRGFDHLTAGVRDAVVFGAGVEYGIDRTVDALLRRRIRTHIVVDAAGSADETFAQIVVARWKRRGVDVLTAATLERLLTARAEGAHRSN